MTIFINESCNKKRKNSVRVHKTWNKNGKYHIPALPGDNRHNFLSYETVLAPRPVAGNSNLSDVRELVTEQVMRCSEAVTYYLRPPP